MEGLSSKIILAWLRGSPPAGIEWKLHPSLHALSRWRAGRIESLYQTQRVWAHGGHRATLKEGGFWSSTHEGLDRKQDWGLSAWRDRSLAGRGGWVKQLAVAPPGATWPPGEFVESAVSGGDQGAC